MTVVEAFYKMPEESTEDVINLLETFLEIITKAIDPAKISAELFINVYGIKKVNDMVVKNDKVRFLINLFEERIIALTIGANLTFSELGSNLPEAPASASVAPKNKNKDLVNETFRVYYEEPT